MNWTDQATRQHISEKLLRKKLFIPTNIEKVHVIHDDKVVLLMERGSEWGTRNHHQRVFGKVWTIYIENVDQKMNVLWLYEIESRLRFERSFSTFWDIFGGLCTQFFLFIGMGKRWLEVISVVKSKIIPSELKYKTRHFQNLIRKRFLRETDWNQKQIGISKCNLVSL